MSRLSPGSISRALDRDVHMSSSHAESKLETTASTASSRLGASLSPVSPTAKTSSGPAGASVSFTDQGSSSASALQPLPSPAISSSTVQSLAALASQQHDQYEQQQSSTSSPLSRPDGAPAAAAASAPAPPTNITPPSFFSQPVSPPPPRKDTDSSVSTQATSATLASTETNNTSYSADTSPRLHQSIFSLTDGSDVSNSRRTSRRRTGPLSQQSREKAALIRKLGACHDCRRRRVACHPSHHNMTWEDVVNKFHRSHSPTIHEIAPSLAAAGQPMSAVPQHSHGPLNYGHESQEMDIDFQPSSYHHSGRHSLPEARHRTPLPSGPRLEKSLSLPGIEHLKNELQSNAARMLSTSTRTRYTAVYAQILFWEEDDEVSVVHDAAKNLADVLVGSYHYTVNTTAIPSSTDGSKSSWRWLSRELNAFAENRDQRDVLKIVYYAGHTYLDGNRDMVLASSRDPQRATVIRWNGIQQILEEACADTLIIMDAAYYSSSKMVRQTGVLELIAASMSDEHYGALDRCAFTLAFADLLRTRATRANPLSAAEAHSALLSNYHKLVKDKHPEKEILMSFPTPLHTMISGNSRLPSIYLSPICKDESHGNSVYDNQPLLQMSIRLGDDNVDIDSWNEWLRLMPDGVKEVKVEGPFKASYR